MKWSVFNSLNKFNFVFLAVAKNVIQITAISIYRIYMEKMEEGRRCCLLIFSILHCENKNS